MGFVVFRNGLKNVFNIFRNVLVCVGVGCYTQKKCQILPFF